VEKYEITEDGFDIKKEIAEGRICPAEVVDATVWVSRSRLEIRMDKISEGDWMPCETVLFLWDYFNKKSFMVTEAETVRNSIYLEADQKLMEQIHLVQEGSVRVAAAFRSENQYCCGYVRNTAAKDSRLTSADRLIGRLSTENDHKHVFTVYWTEGGILSGRFERIKNSDSTFGRMKLSGYHWDDGKLNCYVETAAVLGDPEFALISVEEGIKNGEAVLDAADCGFNSLHRLFKIQIDFSHVEDLQKEKYLLECHCGGFRSAAVMDDVIMDTDFETTVLSEAGKKIPVGIEKDDSGRFLVRLGKKQRLFSIIMSVYNVAPYMEEAVESIVNQDIGFLENVQLILVNDGSTDQSGFICERYAAEYPDNVIYVEKENGGLSSARNTGLEYVEARYVNFFDPDDILERNVLSEVADFLERNGKYIDMVCVPLVYFEGQTGLHGKYAPLGNKNKIISLVKEPYNFILSAASSFYKSEMFEKIRFDERMMTAEDTKVNVQILRHTLKFGYVCENGVKYHYRRRAEGGSNVDAITGGDNFEALMAPIYIFDDLFERTGYLAPYEQELIAYELRSRLKTIKREAFTEEAYQTIIQAYKRWIGKLDDRFIADSKWLDMVEKKVLFLNLSERSFGDWIRNGFSDISDRLIRVRNLYIENKYVHIDCIYNNFGEKEIELVLLPGNKRNGILFPSSSTDIDGPFNLMIGEFCTDYTHIRHYKVPLENAEYVFAYYDSVNDSFAPVRRVQIYGKARCAANIRGVGPVREGYCVSLWDCNLWITDDEKIVSGVTKTLQKSRNRELPFRHLADREKRYILISDRPEKAGDNGEALFEYIMEHEEQEIRDVTYFVINKKCRDYTAMKYKDHVVDFRSTEHLLMFLNAKMIYSSHNAIRFYYPFPEEEYKNYADLLDYKFVWLQHGVIKDDLSKDANKLNTLDDAFVTSSYWEYNEILRDAYLYQKEDVLLTGLARFDKLLDNREKLITIAPTWRKGLVGEILADGHNAPKTDFEKTKFYCSYMQLLTSRKLQEILLRYGYRVEFVLHSGFTCYEKLFEAVNSKLIHLVRMEEFSYRDAFCRSSLFVTDYSSAVFDFAYLKKPVIYFQFDEDEFFSTHYSKGTYDYREDGFGPVLESADAVVDRIAAYLETGCEMESAYKERVDRTFAYVDQNNCKRILDATRKWIKK